jgi:ATP-dependent DNA helicase DinG
VALGHVMYEASEKLVSACQELVGFMEDVDGAAIIQRDIASTAMALKDLLASAELILFDGSATFAYAAHLIKRGQGGENLQALMLNVGSAMNEMLYARAHSIVFTSATMTIAQSFESFNSSMGLGESEHSAVRTCYLESSYDFDANMVVYIAEDMPEPNAPGYLEALEKLLIGVHRAQQGSTLTLFTNRREMEKSYQTVQRAVKQDDLRIVCQKWGVSVKGLRDDFLSDEHLSLFALKSFWEGFDAPGATLKTVVIPKLPFGKPTDPLSCERGQVDPQAWSHYVLPAAVLETKQAAGRLIRTSTDRGALVLADKRLITKGYGKVFLNSLPSRNIQVLSSSEIFEVLSRESERR